jgi:tRNA pseudouridine38-40 synthase
LEEINLKLFVKISYRGTAYSGYQVQNNAPTVQQKLNEASRAIFGCDCDITGCSRTDSGVHANGFCATVTRKGEGYIETTVPLERIPRALNTFLPEDVSVFFAEYVDDEFHPRYSVKSKEYVYKIYVRPERDAFLSGRVWHLPRILDTAAMKEAAKRFVGYHDFAAFMAQGSKIVDTRRTVYSADIETDGDTVIFRVSADGFLYNMVRIMVGTLTEVGEGRIKPHEIDKIIEGKDRAAAGKTAPPDGLYLNKAVY